MNKKLILWTAGVCSLLFLNSCNEDLNETVSTSDSLESQLKFKISDFQIIEINADDIKNQVSTHTKNAQQLSLNNGALNFEIVPVDESITVTEYFNENGQAQEKKHTLAELGYFQGAKPEDNLIVNISDEGFYASFNKNDQNYIICQAKNFVENAADNKYVYYAAENVLDQSNSEGECAFQAEQSDSSLNDAHVKRTYYPVVNVYLDGTFERYFNYNYYNIRNYIYSTLVQANNVFRRSRTTLQLGGYRIFYASAWGASNLDFQGIRNNVASLRGQLSIAGYYINRYTSRDDLNIVYTRDFAHWGVSLSQTICNYSSASNQVAIVEYKSSTTHLGNIVAHEMGHILGQPYHTSYGIMRPAAPTGYYEAFDTTSSNNINNWCYYYGGCM